MKRISTLCLITAIALGGARAQITIGQNEMPHAGDNLYRTRAVTNPFVNVTATGPAHTWDYSNLAANGPDTAAYQSVASTNFVYAIVYADVFFNANRSNHARPGVDIAFNQLLPITNPFTFLNRNASVYEKVGYGVSLAGIPVPIIFNQHDVIYNLPLHYNDAGSSFSSYNLNIPSLGYYGYEQTRSNVVDGWGAITTPGGTFDVLRVKTTLSIHDSLHIDTLGTGFAIDRPILHEYKWLTQDLRVPVLQINTTTLFGLEVVSDIFYYDVPRSITVVAPLASTICPGAAVDVHYETTGAFNAGGFFVQANHFTVQLSDANGSFTNPVVIGDLTATGPGIISATIPANTPPGTGYRIRVVSNSPAYTGADNGYDITIGGNTVATISASGPASICSGDVLTLTAVGGPSYQWRSDGADIFGETNATYEATTAGVYTVAVNNACGAATSNAITVVVNEPPAYAVDQQSYLVCSGSAAQIVAHDQTGQSPVSYQWLLNNAPIAGALDSTVNATLAGAYTLEVTNQNTGCIFTTPDAMVAVESVPTPAVTASGTTTFCAGGSVMLDASVVPDAAYQWYLDGAMIADATGTMVVADAPGTYTVVATSANNCISDPSEATIVTVNAVPDAPVITPSGPTTICAGGEVALTIDTVAGLNYQWTLDGVEIAGADSDQIAVTEAGAYAVVVTGDGGCSATSDPSINVDVNPAPPIPVITPVGETLSASGSGSFQWSLDNTPIPGATDPTIVPTSNGSYTVEFTDASGCSSVSDPYVYLSTGVQALTATGIQVLPNPSNGSFMISAGSGRTDLYEVADATGKRVRTGSLTGPSTYLDLRDQAEGVYFLHFTRNGSVQVLRMVIVR